MSWKGGLKNAHCFKCRERIDAHGAPRNKPVRCSAEDLHCWQMRSGGTIAADPLSCDEEPNMANETQAQKKARLAAEAAAKKNNIADLTGKVNENNSLLNNVGQLLGSLLASNQVPTGSGYGSGAQPASVTVRSGGFSPLPLLILAAVVFAIWKFVR